MNTDQIIGVPYLTTGSCVAVGSHSKMFGATELCVEG